MEARHGRVPTHPGAWIDVSQESVFAIALLLPFILGAFLLLSTPAVNAPAAPAPVIHAIAPARGSAPPRATAVASPTIAAPTAVPVESPKAIQASILAQDAVLTPDSAPPTATFAVPTPTVLVVGRVANTSGDGVFLRHTPSLSDRWIAWPDKTPLVVLGEETSSDGLAWLQVRDPKNHVGWVPAQYVAR